MEWIFIFGFRLVPEGLNLFAWFRFWHSKVAYSQNVVNLIEIWQRAATFGITYNPVNIAYSLVGLEEISTSARLALTASTHAVNIQKRTTGDFNKDLKNYCRLVTRSMNSLIICGASEFIIQQGRAMVRDIRGQRVSRPAQVIDDEATENGTRTNYNIRHISNSDFQLVSIDRYLQLIVGVPEYNPNEPDLKPMAMSVLLYNLKIINAHVKRTQAISMAARRERDLVFFAKHTGLYAIQKGMKLYTKSVFGSRSSEYISVRGYRFSNKKINS